MLDIFVSKAFTVGTLRQPDTLPERLVVGFGIGRVQLRNRVGALDANRHGECAWLPRGVSLIHDTCGLNRVDELLADFAVPNEDQKCCGGWSG